MRYAGFWVRFWATIIDSICLLPLFFIQSIFEKEGLYGFSFLISLIVSCLFNALFESGGWQATPGKRLLGLRVVDLNGNKISFGRAVGRYFGKWLSSLIFGIGYIMVGITDRKQGLHDKLAETYVVRNPSGFSDSKEEFSDYGNIKNKVTLDIFDAASSSAKYVLAGFDTSGHVVRLTFNARDPKLLNDGLVIGRNSDFCDLQINDPSVSRRHAKFFVSYGDLFVEDLASTNGVFVDGNKCLDRLLVVNDSKITFGDVELTIGKY